MSERTGTTISCDRWIDKNPCGSYVFEDTPEEARAAAERRGYTRTEDGRDYCSVCSEVRASRKSPAELVPEGVRLMEPFDACEAVGFERRDYNEETGEAHFYHCGQEVEYFHFIGVPYGAECKVCGVRVGSVFSPHFSNSTVAFFDSDKVVTEDPASWVVVSELEAARANEETSP